MKIEVPTGDLISALNIAPGPTLELLAQGVDDETAAILLEVLQERPLGPSAGDRVRTQAAAVGWAEGYAAAVAGEENVNPYANV